MSNGGALNSQFHGLPYNDMYIEFDYDSDISSKWKIVDTQGTQYIFGESESAREITHSESWEEGKNVQADVDWDIYIYVAFGEDNLPGHASRKCHYV